MGYTVLSYPEWAFAKWKRKSLPSTWCGIMGCRTLCLSLLFLIGGACAQPQCTLITPSLLRVESEETVVVDAQGHNVPFEAEITIQDFPRRELHLASAKVSLDRNNGFLGTAKVKIGSTLPPATRNKQFVYVNVNSTLCKLEKVVLLSQSSGYIFIQTDKTIYTPESLVLYRIYSTSYNLQPIRKTIIIDFVDPDGINVKRDFATNDLTSLSFRLPQYASIGEWTIAVKYEDAPQQNYTTKFEVKEYVLPTVKVILKPEKNYFYVDTKTFRVNIQVLYLYGKPADGYAFVLFGIKKDNVIKEVLESATRVKISHGEGHAELKREQLGKYFSKPEEMVQYRLYVRAKFVSETGSDKLEAHSEDIPFVTSPYKVFLTKTTKYFKPGFPFLVKVSVTYPDGSPAQYIPVVAEPARVVGITQTDGTTHMMLDTSPNIEQLPITVRTNQGDYPAQYQASATLTAKSYHTAYGSGNYLHIGIAGSTIKPGEHIIISFTTRNSDPSLQSQIQHFTYLIMSRGRIIKVGRQPRQPGQTTVAMFLRVTEDYLPSFRIVAYYAVTTTKGRDIVSDSVWVEVVDTCMGTLGVTGYKDKDNEVQRPGLPIKLKLRAEPKAKVVLVAVDQGVFVENKKHRITQSKIWDTVEKGDIGCTPGGGADSAGVFFDAGLAVQTSDRFTTPQRSEWKCQTHSLRRRRSAEYDEGDDDQYINEFWPRVEFPESWYWRMEQMPEKPDTYGISTKILNVFLKDSITTWEVLAVSLSDTKGLCVAPPYEIRVAKDFSIDLKLPHSVVRNEQVEIRAVIYNHKEDKMKVRVELAHNSEYCSLSTNKKNFHQVIWVDGESSAVVPFVIVPLTLGLHDIEVRAAVYGMYVSDSVRKRLKVLPEGLRMTQTVTSMTLNPEAEGKDGVQEITIKALNLNSIVAGTDIDARIILQGILDDRTSEGSIDGATLSPLIVVPSGSVEQNMVTMISNVIAALYLDTTNQWEQVGLHRRGETIKNIKQGYGQQLSYRKADNSFVPLAAREASVWLNAYIIKGFTMAEDLIIVNRNVLCGAIKWLILVKQMSNGQFQEIAPITHTEMMGGIKLGEAESDATLTAFVLIAMLESQNCISVVNNLLFSSNRAADFLMGRYSALRKPYSVAITSYALALAGKLQDTNKLMSAATDMSHWEEQGSPLISVEATSYALLALLKMQKYQPTHAIVRWLKGQKDHGETYRSAQATLIMFQALAQYYTGTKYHNELDLDVTFDFLDRRPLLSYRFNPSNAMLARVHEGRIFRDFVVKAKGKGKCTLKVVYVYYAFVSENERTSSNFDLSVNVKEETMIKRPEVAKATISLEVCARNLKNGDVSMPVIDISMMTGFFPDVDSLEKLMKGVDKYVSKYEINKGAKERANLIIFLDKISHTKQECVKFYAHQFFNVGLIQPASVTVYDYNSPENHSSKFYHMKEGSDLLGRICQGYVCRCVEENCFQQQQNQDEITSSFRVYKACDKSVDYVYKASLVDIQHGENTDYNKMTIKRVIKEGSDESSLGEARTFISHTKCQKALDLKAGRDYLIFGPSSDLWRQPSGYSYIIGKDTWIEWWPNESECQRRVNMDLCDDLDTVSDTLEIWGCTH
ncbi:hypothetical protein XENTR_v10010132 [Xenopus tropicalis]|nr:hypothetical protein XENTR_v10010132 [Xenopus tropicalis]